MNHMKRLLAMLLALVMIVGVLPLSVFADEYDTATGDFAGDSIKDTAVIFSDLHTSSSNYKETTVKEIMGALKNANLPISSVTSAGDAFSVNSDSGKYTGKTSTISGYIRTALGNSTLPVNYVWSDHDRYALQEDDKTLLDKTSHLVYGAGEDGIYGNADDDNYYIYVLSMADTSSNDRYSAGFNYTATNHTNRENAGFTATVELAIENFRNDVEGLDQSKPLLIVGHQPLLDRRDDNAWAEYWVAAINEVAKDMDVAYFHGHNHKYDKAEDYYYAKGSQMPVPDWDDWGWKYNTGAQSTVSMDSVSTTLNFTHICAGYMAPGSTGSTSSTTRDGVALAVTVTDNKLQFTTYNKNGVSSTGYGVDITIDRDHANANVPKNVAVTGKIDYQVGDTVKAPSSVKVTYMDGNVSELAEGYSLTKITKGETEYTVEGFTFPEAGEYVLTYTCTVGNYKAQAALNVTVVAAADGEEEPEGKPEEQVKLPVVAGANVTEAKDVTAQVKIENVTNFVAYDIVAEMTGETAMVSIPVPSDWIVGELKAYYVDASGNLTDESFEVTYADGYATFTVTHFSTYALTNTLVETEWIRVSIAQNKTIFRLTDSLTAGETYVIVSRNTAGNGTATNLNGTSINTVPVEVFKDGNTTYIEEPATTAQWTYSSSRFRSVSSSTNRYLRGSSSTLSTTSTTGNSSTYITWSYSDGSYGLRVRSGSSSGSYRYMTSVTGTSQNSSNTNRVYLYVEEKINTEELWAKMEAPTTINFGVGEGNEAAVKEQIKVWTASDANGTGSKEVTDYRVEGSVNYAVAGTYTVKVMYGEEELGEIQIVVSSEPSLKITEGGEVKDLVTRTHVNVGDKIQLGVIAFNGSTNEENPTIIWSIADEDKTEATVDANGLVTVLNNNTHFRVQASWTYEGVEKTAYIDIGVSPDSYLTPNVSTNDFPEYPNEGAIRFDKTATAVGSFSETGVAQLELSMTGIPYGNRLDVVLMLDRSSSMDKASIDRIGITIEATEAFIRSIVMDEDGTYNNNRILILDFLGGNPAYSTSQHAFQANRYTLEDEGEDGYEVISNDAELEALLGRIKNTRTGFVGQTNVYGTDYANGLKACYDALMNSKEDGNKQFCVFMSDGIPNTYQGEYVGEYGSTNQKNAYCDGTTTQRNNNYTPKRGVVDMFKVTNVGTAAAAAERDTDYMYEHYSTLMKNNGITVFSVGLGLKDDNSSWSGASAEACELVGNILLNDIAGPAGETAEQRDTGNTVSKLDKYFFSVADADAATAMKNVFENIALKIKDAATDIVVTDKITEQYHMIFGIPQSAYDDEKAKDRNDAVKAALEGQDLYIEVVNYALDNKHERVGDPASLVRIYLKDSNGTAAGGTYSAAIDNKGTAAKPLVFQEKGEAKKAYWSKVDSSYHANPNEIVIEVDGTYWKFMERGNGTHNVASGAYAFGNIDEKTNYSEDLVIVTPYFAYSASTRMLSWTVSKVEEFKEIALRYFLYLDASSTEIGTEHETPQGTYPTNEWATITYTNFNGNECRQEFPVPQMTWNGAQVSYVFYLVNENGEPINKAGQVVNFANAVFVTDIFTTSVVWNDTDTPNEDVEVDGDTVGVAYLDAQWMASSKLPTGYKLYDELAYYELKVYENESGVNLDNYFKIDGGAGNTTKVYNTKAGVKYDEYKTYKQKDVVAGFDFANTTVAFAIVWEMKLVEDTVVVDFGLDVLINVVQNDFLQNTISGISETNTDYDKLRLNDAPTMPLQELEIDGHTIKVESENQIRFHQNNMTFTEAIEFYYESKVTYYVGGEPQPGYMSAKVTVIPATTIYYEDSFISNNDLKTYTWNGTGWDAPTTGLGTGTFSWKLDGTQMNNTQAQDRPGPSQISAALDADNNYGYDGAYKSMSHHSMGSALKVHVDYDHMATAEFDFWGTGFDVISMTTSATGTIIVNVYKPGVEKPEVSYLVNTYYGFTYDGENWVPTDPTNPDVLYQVPVMKVSDLKYGQYRAEIKVVYDPIFDQGLYDNASYDFFLDAIRIYDPTGNEDEISNEAYLADGEAWPAYTELRDMVLSAEEAQGDDTLEGVVFIDGGKADPDKKVSVTDYSSFGPNNELYLAKNQSIAFTLNATAVNGSVAGIQLGIKSVGGTGHVVITANGKEYINMDVASATDLYYDLAVKDFNGKTVTITSTGDAIISLTNVKVTYTASQETEKAETTDYLLSVNANTILVALLSLNPKETIELPSAPVAPNLPVLPETPAKPVQPVKPGKPAKPGKPGLPVQPVQPVPPVQPEQPVKPVQPNKPVQPGKPGLPGSHLAVAIY